MKPARQRQLTRFDPNTDHMLGSPSAAVIVLEYADFSAPACAQAYPALKLLQQEFGKEISLIFRHFPERAIHPLAEMAAEAAEAMGAQGRFWPYHDLLFEHHAHLSEHSLRDDAGALEADLLRFDVEMRGHVYLQRVQEQMEVARALGIRAMPTFFVNGELVDVSFGIDRLVLATEAVLADIDPG